jgi:hypothetical protein
MTTFKVVRAVLRTMQKGEWRDSGRTIRTADEAERCPISFAATVATGEPYTTSDYIHAANKLNINAHDRELIAGAADNFDGDWASMPTSLKKDGCVRLQRAMRKVAGL